MNDNEKNLINFFEIEYDNLFAYCRKSLYDEQMAEDCVCEVFFRALDNEEKLKTHPNPTGWLFKAAQLVTKEIHRKNRCRRIVFVFFDSFESIDDAKSVIENKGEALYTELDVPAAKHGVSCF